MDFFRIIVPAILLLIIGRLLYGRLKYGSWTGSFLKGRIEKTVGEVSISRIFGTSQRMQVHTMRDGDRDDSFVALVVTSKAPMAASMQPFKLTNSQALELAEFLKKAAHGGIAYHAVAAVRDR